MPHLTKPHPIHDPVPGMPGWIVRRATRNDIPTIIALLADDHLGQQREKLTDPLPDAYYEAFNRIDADPNQALIVAEDPEGRVMATFQFTLLPGLSFQGSSRALIEAVRVHQELRGQGVGGRLMQWAVDHARTRGAHIVQLMSHQDRPDAHRFYERLGFKATHVGMKLHI